MGKIKVTNEAAPATPASGVTNVYVDSTSKKLSSKDDAGAVTDYSDTDPDINGKTSVTAAAGDEILIADVSDSNNLKKVTAQSVADLAAAVTPAWTTFTPVLNDGGTLTYTTANARYYITGKLMFMHFDWTQTNAGSGTDDITIDVPGGATVLDSEAAGFMVAIDIGNNNVYKNFGIHSINSLNKFKMTFSGSTAYLRGGNMIGNNGFGRGINITVAIE